MTLDLIIAWSIRLGLSLLFVMAAWHKVSDRPRFEAAVTSYELLPERASILLSWLLPLLEAAIAGGILYPATQRAAALAASALLLVYTGAIAINLARGRRRIDCGCFSSRSAMSLNGGLIVRNIGLTAAACALFLPVRMRALAWVDGFTLVATLVTVSLLWATAQRLSQTGPALRRQEGIR